MFFSTLTTVAAFTALAFAQPAHLCAIGSRIIGDGDAFSTKSCAGTGSPFEISIPFQVGCDESCFPLSAKTESVAINDLSSGCTGKYQTPKSSRHSRLTF